MPAMPAMPAELATRREARQDAHMPEWDSEIEVGEDLARALIAAQFSELDATSLRRIGEGWDNTVRATGDDIAFRFPRREIAIPGVEREMAILPELAAQLPAPIPDATYAGAPSAEFPWPWFGSRLIAGQKWLSRGSTPPNAASSRPSLGSS
jgi:aminoglycoside phosphotransferase (APT) family kinase protein